MTIYQSILDATTGAPLPFVGILLVLAFVTLQAITVSFSSIMPPSLVTPLPYVLLTSKSLPDNPHSLPLPPRQNPRPLPRPLHLPPPDLLRLLQQPNPLRPLPPPPLRPHRPHQPPRNRHRRAHHRPRNPQDGLRFHKSPLLRPPLPRARG